MKNQSHLDKVVKRNKLQHPITNQEIEIIDPDKNQNSAEIIGNFYSYNENEIENLYTQLN